MDLTEGVDLKTRRIPDALSDASCSTKPDSDFLSFNDNRHLSNTTGMREHFLQFTAFTSYIYVLRSVSIGRPGIFCVRSTAFSINDHFLIHESGSFPKLFATRKRPFSRISASIRHADKSGRWVCHADMSMCVLSHGFPAPGRKFLFSEPEPHGFFALSLCMDTDGYSKLYNMWFFPMII